MSAPHRPRPRRARPAGRSRQRGLSMVAVAVVLAVSAFLGLFAFKVGPAYLENATINKIVADKAADGTLRGVPRSKAYQLLNAAYRMNSLYDLKAEDTVELRNDGASGYRMTVRYEKRENLFSNIDVVTRFEKSIATDL